MKKKLIVLYLVMTVLFLCSGLIAICVKGFVASDMVEQIGVYDYMMVFGVSAVTGFVLIQWKAKRDERSRNTD